MSDAHLRLVNEHEHPAPRIDDDSAAVLNEAVDALARLRTPYWLGDTAVRLHALTSLIRQAEQLLAQAVADSRDQDLTWKEIGQLLNTTPASAARRYRPNK
jgi:signal recognition particle GTPase